MSDDTRRPEPDSAKPRRFRLTRRVEPAAPPVETEAERSIREAAQDDDTLKGYPEQEREIRRGCSGCVNVTLLLFVIMIASIIATCAVRK